MTVWWKCNNGGLWFVMSQRVFAPGVVPLMCFFNRCLEMDLQCGLHFVFGKMECCRKWIDFNKCSLWLVVDLCDEANMFMWRWWCSNDCVVVAW
ncbi:hypothetical protein DEO72_LG2g13 [Vigna unguiculata]|uniref:Uncharacterized protein n=1 Tax=Vigna unguiculata TaxID=3917 RepID=A0A4D6KWG4_VIGUN|nr:hypothetical protein DEO72_LG2g12 [Vigna unguiculata]QCD79699.1 hypothetical protein DEO72_LG2g13 [Vigna unguiculata]